MARRFKQPDPKFAPRNVAAQAEPVAFTDTHLRDALGILSERTLNRSAAYRQEAEAFLRDWNEKQPLGFQGNTPRQLAIAAIVAVSIRVSQREKEEEHGTT